MPLFDYACDCGARFEAFVTSWRCEHPACPGCGGATRRLPSRTRLIGRAQPPPGDARAPRSWDGTGGGDRETIAHWQRTLERRRTFEEANPEHATRRDAVAAHEGAFRDRPLTYRELADRSTTTGDASAGAAEATRDRLASSPSPTSGP
jgi:putative FmdB family regulatory protein